MPTDVRTTVSLPSVGMAVAEEMKPVTPVLEIVGHAPMCAVMEPVDPRKDVRTAQ